VQEGIKTVSNNIVAVVKGKIYPGSLKISQGKIIEFINRDKILQRISHRLN